MTELFERRDLDQYADSLARYLPNDRLFASKFVNGSNLRDMLVGMATELFRANGELREYANNILPDRTVLFIDEWERAVGIPDHCFTGSGTLEERRRAVLVKLASLGVQTIDDFQNLADMFDVTTEVIAGEDFVIPVAFPKFTIIVRWLGVTPEQAGQINIISCLFSKLKPANVDILFFPLNFFAQAGEVAMQCGEEFAQCGNSLV